MVVHGNRLERLTELVAEWLQRYPLAPLETETVLVQSNGMAQWLKLKLAEPQALGIAAACRFQMPARFLWDLYREVLSEEQVPHTSPFDKSRLLWRLYRLLPALLDRPAFEPLRHFLGDDEDQRKRHQLAERLADLFDAYQVYRADWLADWEAGDDRLRRTPERAESLPVPPGQQWQPELWRAVLEDLPDEFRHLSRAAIHNAALARLAQDPAPAGLPRRVVVFGISALPQQALAALAALGAHSQVLLLVQNPCQLYWADIVEDRDLLRRQLDQRRRHLSVPTDNPVHPLLAAWGKQGRDFIGLLYDHDDPDQYRHAFDNQIDLFDEPPADGTLLQHLQRDILTLTPPPETNQRPTVAADNSITFAIAHGPQREVEALQDALLKRFDEDPTLRPRDVIVMVPDIETYAPHIEAVFGRLDRSDPRWLPYTLSDRSAAAASPLAQAVEALLHLPQWRFTSTEIFGLLDVPALRQRFGIADSDLPRLGLWIEQANIRWGLHQQQRASLGVPGFEQNSWAFGLRRMLAGYLLGDGDTWRNIEPLDEVAGLGAELAGRLARLLERLDHHWQALRQPARPQQWLQRFSAMLDDLFEPQSQDDQTLDASLRDALSDWIGACQDAALNENLPLTVASRPLLDALGAEGQSQRFMAGRINFCTLMPMRAIPFRHVCLLGMKDGDYPRQHQPMDFDLMRARVADQPGGQRRSLYRPGDRSRREDDRYLFLEALLSARSSLYISWSGRSARDNSERPPSVLVAQLRDHLDQCWQTADPALPLSAALTSEHPLQPFSRRYFFHPRHDDQRSAPPPTYASEWQALYATPTAPAPAAALPRRTLEEALDADALSRFLKQPVAHFFRQRLKANLQPDSHSLEETEPFSIDGLQRWQLQAHLLEAGRQAGETHFQQALETTLEQLAAAGYLPRAPFDQPSRKLLAQPLKQPLRTYFQRLAAYPQVRPPEEISLSLEEGLQLEDWLSDLRTDGNEQRRVLLVTGKLERRWSKLMPAWVVHLLACASALPLTTELIAEDGNALLPPLPPDQARHWLGRIAEGWQQGLQQPLPVTCNTAFAWLTGAEKDRAETEARKVFGPAAFGALSELGRSAFVRRAWPDFELLLAQREAGSEAPALALWTERLYAPLYRHCQWHEADTTASGELSHGGGPSHD